MPATIWQDNDHPAATINFHPDRRAHLIQNVALHICLAESMEVYVAGKFRVEYGIHGAAVTCAVEPLTAGCLADGEIDFAIDTLIADLERCRSEMKRRAIKEKDAIFKKRFARA